MLYDQMFGSNWAGIDIGLKCESLFTVGLRKMDQSSMRERERERERERARGEERGLVNC